MKEKKLGVIYRGELSVHHQAQQEVKFLGFFLLGGEDLEIWRVGVVNLAVYSLCIEGDD